MSGNQQGLQGPRPEERPHPDGRRNSQGIRIDPEVAAEPDSRTAMISALVEDEPGVLARVSGLFSRRQFNIESLTVGPTTVEGNSRLTLIVEEPEPGIDQAKKQLAKLKPVISVGELEGRPTRSELVLLKINGDEPDKVQAVTEMYGGETLDAGPKTITVQLTGGPDTIGDALDAYRQFGIIEIARTGPTALARGNTPTTPGEKPAAEATAVGVETDGGSESNSSEGAEAETQAETTN